MEVTSLNRTKKYWARWVTYISLMGVDPYLQDTSYTWQARLLTGFAARVHSGFFGQKGKVSVGTVNSAITAIDTTIALVRGINPTKLQNLEALILTSPNV